ncbi:Alpha/beta hydrolase fold-1 [Xylariales sp. PMI_506]|nr:Alpha/beta hydrolase fold-1 [Xylariales sp. PMI_506]
MGYEFICPHLPSLGPDSSGVTYLADVEAIQNISVQYFEKGRTVVLVGHSAGGVPACAATENFDVLQRTKDGKPGGFQHVIFLAAFPVPVRGWDLVTTFGEKLPDWQESAEPYTKGHLMRVKEAAKDFFYNDVPQEEKQKNFDMLLPHSQDTFETPVNFIPADLQIPKTYIICENDQALPAAVQRRYASQVPNFRVESIDAGHSPFLSRPAELAKLINKVIENS